MIDSDKPPNNLAHWFQSDKTVSFVPRPPHEQDPAYPVVISACRPPPHLRVTHRGPHPHANKPIYHVCVMGLSFFTVFSALIWFCGSSLIWVEAHFGLVKSRITNNSDQNVQKEIVFQLSIASDLSVLFHSLIGWWFTWFLFIFFCECWNSSLNVLFLLPSAHGWPCSLPEGTTDFLMCA